MRPIAFLVPIALFMGSSLGADEAPGTIQWMNSSEIVSALKAKNTLHFVLITNDDPIDVDETGRRASDDLAVWCQAVLNKAILRAFEKRPNLRSRFLFHQLRAGIPKELTGGESRNSPARAMVAVCDENHRLLSLLVGCPRSDDILALVEDAQEFDAIRKLTRNGEEKTTDHQDAYDMLLARSRKRVSRMWLPAIADAASTVGASEHKTEPEDMDTTNRRIQSLIEIFEPVYLKEMKRRFELASAEDQNLLIILEQHPETRRHWCEAMIPFIADIDFLSTRNLFIESIWGHQPIGESGGEEELLDWYDLQVQSSSLVLAIRPPFHLQHLPWPPMDDRDRTRGLSWSQAHKKALTLPFRTIDGRQLAILIRSRSLDPVDLWRPSPARYVLLKPDSARPIVVREADPPSKFANQLKRSKSSLVQQRP